jgi:DNA-binding transcriptional regulator YiaG
MGVRVLLINSALEVEHDGAAAVIVPDLQGLEAAVAVARATVPDKLSGKEIRFLRKTICMKAAELARFLDVTAETISRWENSKEVISTNAERVFRLKVLTDLREKAVGVEAKLNAVVEMKFSPFRTSMSPTTLTFERVGAVVEGRREKIWLYQGVTDEQEDCGNEVPLAKSA